MSLDNLVNESAFLVYKIRRLFNLLIMQATAREKKQHCYEDGAKSEL